MSETFEPEPFREGYIQERYATGEEAKLGHAQVVADLRAQLARGENPI